VKLHAVDKEKITKKFVGRKGQAAEKKSEEHHPIAAWGLGDAIGAGKDDLIPFSDEPILLGLGEIDLHKFRWYPVGRRVGSLLPHLILVGKALDAHLRKLRAGAAQEAQKRTRIAAMVAAEEARIW
jgi:hypothetical protein